MIREIATLTIDPANASAFEAAAGKAKPYFHSAEGFHSFRLDRVIENPGQYLLVIGWESVAHHMETFRESADFQEWRALVGPYLTAPPSVVHTQDAEV